MDLQVVWWNLVPHQPLLEPVRRHHQCPRPMHQLGHQAPRQMMQVLTPVVQPRQLPLPLWVLHLPLLLLARVQKPG